MAAEMALWRRVVAVAGLTRAEDAPFLFWPLLWAAWLATAGHPEPWSLIAFMVSVLLARSALWSGFLPEAGGLVQVWNRRRFLLVLFGLGALCFALPLGLGAATLVALALALAAGWFVLRRRSYLSEPLLAVALMLPPLAVWLAEGAALNKSAGLLLLAVALWSIAALLVTPVQRDTAHLAVLVEPAQRPLAAGLLRLAALLALGLAGRQSQLGLWFLSGLTMALLVVVVRWANPRRAPRLPPWGWEALWGGAVFLGLLFHFWLAAEGPRIV